MNENTVTPREDNKILGLLTVKQLAVVSVVFVLSLVLTLTGWSYNFFGLLIIIFSLYLVPQMVGITDFKFMAGFGAVFAVLAIILGAAFVAPAIYEDNSGNPPDNANFENVVYTYEEDGIHISADFRGEIGDHDVLFHYAEVKYFGFSTIKVVTEYKSEIEVPLTVEGNKVTGIVKVPSDKLYIGILGLTKTTDDGKEVLDSSKLSNSRFLADAYDGEITNYALMGCAYFVMIIMIVFYMVLLFSRFMRKRVDKTRDRMESEGRLYPVGYGRCDKCKAVILPQDINCRKCGAYIDRPEEMRMKKSDFCECSECGSEVPHDATVCPKCGATFDEEELIREPGPVRPGFMFCSKCGTEMPEKSEFCPKCGEKAN